MLILKDYCASLKNERLKTEKCEKNVPIRVKDFLGPKRDFLLQNLLLDKWCLWLNGLKSHYGVTGDGLMEKLKNEFRRVVLEQ